MSYSANQLIAKLRKSIERMPPALQAAAKYVIDYPGDFGLDPIRITSENIGVSPNVLVRLAQHMGFERFEEFRAPFRHALVTDKEEDLGNDWLKTMHEGDAFSQKQAKLAQNAQNVTMRSLRLMSPAKVAQALGYIETAPRCYVTATRASYALAYYFAYAGRMAHPGIHLIPRHMGSAIDDLLDADPSDCLLAITMQPYSADTIETMRYALKKKLKVILVSESDVIAPGIQPDITFQISTQSRHHFSSFSGAAAVLDCLLGHLFDAGGEEARVRIERYEKAREDTGAYLQPAKLPRIGKR